MSRSPGLTISRRPRAWPPPSAMPVGGRRDSFMLGGRPITAGLSGCTRDDGALAGTTLDLATAVRNAVNLLPMPLADALRAASAEPARFLGLGHRLGHLAPGCRADMVALDPNDIVVLQTWVAGHEHGTAQFTACTTRR